MDATGPTAPQGAPTSRSAPAGPGGGSPPADAPPTGFAAATAVTPAGAGRYQVGLSRAYALAGARPNGGYMLACLARAAVAEAGAAGSPHGHPVAAGAQYLRSPDVGPADIDVEVLRVGRSATHVTARLGQGGATAVAARFTLGALPPGGRPYWGGGAPVELAPLERCQGAGMGRRDGVNIVFDPETSFRMTPDGPVSSGGGEVRAWAVPAGDEPIGPVELLFVADALPPATFGVLTTGWVPTLDLSVYVRALPVPGPLRVRFRTGMIQDGYADEVLDAWDADDRLVLQATQLTGVRLPASP